MATSILTSQEHTSLPKYMIEKTPGFFVYTENYKKAVIFCNGQIRDVVEPGEILISEHRPDMDMVGGWTIQKADDKHLKI